MKTGKASALQIAFFTFAVTLLAVPAADWLLRLQPFPADQAALVSKATPFVMAALAILAFPGLRRLCARYLQHGVGPGHRFEVGAVTALKLFLPFAYVGGVALWHWAGGGEPALTRYLYAWRSNEAEAAIWLTPTGMVHAFVLTGILAPLLEELVFRGMLYEALDRRWGWIPALLLTSLLFALYHRSFWVPFVSSVIFVCLYRRTGTLWAPLIAHAVGNMSLWPGLLGWYVVPRNFGVGTELSSWWFHLACLGLALLLVPLYVLGARREPQAERRPPAVAHGALSK